VRRAPAVGAALLAAAFLVAALLASGPAAAQAPRVSPPPDDETRAYLESLRRSDPAAHAKFLALREARDREFAEVVRLQDEMRAAGPNMRQFLAPQLRAARRRYAEQALTLLDFLDQQDRKALGEFEKAIADIHALLAERQRARTELEQLRRE
jgi:hypothetical protein